MNEDPTTKLNPDKDIQNTNKLTEAPSESTLFASPDVEQSRSNSRWILGALAVVVFFLILGAFAKPNQPAKSPPAQAPLSDNSNLRAGAIPTNELIYSVAKKPSFNPCDGKGPDYNIERMKLDGSGRSSFGASVNSSDDEIWPRLSPDRTRFVFYRSPVGNTGEQCRYYPQELWLASSDGKQVKRIFSNDDKKKVAQRLGWDQSISLQGHADWSPDGKHIVMFLGAVPKIFGSLPDIPRGNMQLFVLNVDTAELRQVTNRRNKNNLNQMGDPSSTPDGKTIIFPGCPDNQPAGCPDPQLLSVAADATNATTTNLVYDGPGHGGNDPYVSPDGKKLSWIEPGLAGTTLYVAPFTLGQPIQPNQVKAVDTAAGYASWTADNRLVFNNIYSLFVNNLDGKQSKKITPNNLEEAFTFPSP